jgi:hypothetical protein
VIANAFNFLAFFPERLPAILVQAAVDAHLYYLSLLLLLFIYSSADPVRDYRAAVLPGLADRPIRCLSDLTPIVWVARHS